ncbi:MAG: phosphate ABC transporter permease PstA [Proteobacteria bacterium]|nr:phosphate ABC transporter permease PstA [Pseudomonadota bacterium]
MLDIFGRRAKIAFRRAQRNKNPFVFVADKTPEQKWLSWRKTKEAIFRQCGLAAIVISCLFLGALLFSIIGNGYTAFQRVHILLPVEFSADILDPQGTNDPDAIGSADYRKIVYSALLEIFPEATERREKFDLYALTSKGAYYQLRAMVLENPRLIGTKTELWLPAASNVDLFIKRNSLSTDDEIASYKINGRQYAWLKRLIEKERLKTTFNRALFLNGDSQEPERAGVMGSIMGSVFTIIACIAFAFPLGVATAIYLEEFAKENWFTDLIEININNLAAVPSIIYGLLGLSIYINVMGMPRSSALVGGLVLALLILPVIVIATRNALRAVPKAIRFAALAIGATPVQVALHHTFIYALPGIMTGVILGVARALGETSPLLMIGMVAFIIDVPRAITDPATTLPVQIYLWANNPESGFVENTAAAIILLLLVLAIVNAAAAWVRQRFEIKW